MKYILLTIIILLQGISKTADAVEKESKNNVFLDVYDFGATGKGKIPDTKAIQAAIDKSTENGGTVVFPKGIFLSGTIYLKDNVSLYLEPGAVILGSPEIEDYPKNMPDLEFYGSERLFYSLFYAEDKKNITIKGQGTIDGQGAKFVIKNNKKPYRYMNRPYIFWFIKSQNIHIEGINLRNSAFWMQHYLACDNLIIKGIKVYNHSNKNNDMIDIDGCKSVLISDCIGDSDDDALTIKSTSGRINENITVTNYISLRLRINQGYREKLNLSKNSISNFFFLFLKVSSKNRLKKRFFDYYSNTNLFFSFLMQEKQIHNNNDF